MRYLIVTHSDFDALHGQNIRCTYLIRALLKRNHEVHLVVSKNANHKNIRDFCGDKVKIHELFISTPRFGKLKILKYLIFILLSSYFLRKILNMSKPDVIYTSSFLTAYPMIKIKGGLRFVFDVYDLYYEVFSKKTGLGEGSFIVEFLKKMEVESIKRADKIVTVSNSFKNLLAENFNIDPKKIVVVYEGVDTSLFTPMKKNDGLIAKYGLDSKTVITFIGGIEKHDNLDILVDIANKIGKSAIFLIVGSGTYLSALKKKVRREGLSNRFRFTGWVKYNYVAKYLSISDICLILLPPLLSSKGILSTKFYEYLATKKAVVVPDYECFREIVENKVNGMFFKPGNTHSLVSAINYLVRNKTLRDNLAINGYQTVRKRFDITRKSIELAKACEGE